MAKRTQRIDIRVNREEYQIIAQKAHASGMSKSDLLRGAVQDVQIADREDLRQLRNHLSAIGNNHNQIARQLNSMAKAGMIEYGAVSAEELAHYLYGVREKLEQVRRALPKRR